MTKDSKRILGTLVNAAVTTGLNASMTPVAAKVAGTLASGTLERLLGLAQATFVERNMRKLQDWLHEVAASAEYGSPAATFKLIEDNIDQPWAHGPLEDAVRAIRDGIDEAALVYLAKLAAWQVRDRVPPDRWTRRAVGLLLDCDAHTIDALVYLAERLLSRWPIRNGDTARIAIGGPVASFRGKVTIRPAGSKAVLPTEQNAWDQHPLDTEVFAVLRAHQFATEEGRQFAHEGKMMMRRNEAICLVRLFLGTAAAARFPTAE